MTSNPRSPGSDVPELVVVGAASRDRTDDDPRGWRLGGAVAYAALTTARLGLRTGAIIGVDQAAEAADELHELREAGVDILLVPLATGPVFDNVEGPDGRRQMAHSVAAAMPTSVVPREWLDAAAWLLGPVAGELGDEWAGVPRDEALVGVGWQGLLRTISSGAAVGRAAPRPSAIVRRGDVIGLSRDDVDPETDLAVLCGLLRPGATLLVTGGDDGGLALEAQPAGPDRLYRYPAVIPDRVVDPTGAGDVFLATVLAARAQPRLVGGRIGQRYDLRLAAVVASLVVEGTGLSGVPVRHAVRQRLQEAGSRGAGAS